MAQVGRVHDLNHGIDRTTPNFFFDESDELRLFNYEEGLHTCIYLQRAQVAKAQVGCAPLCGVEGSNPSSHTDIFFSFSPKFTRLRISCPRDTRGAVHK